MIIRRPPCLNSAVEFARFHRDPPYGCTGREAVDMARKSSSGLVALAGIDVRAGGEKV
jgi:hypothetical protein